MYPWHLGYAISRQSYLEKASTRGPSEPLRGPQEGRGFRLRNPGPATTVAAGLFKLFAAVI